MFKRIKQCLGLLGICAITAILMPCSVKAETFIPLDPWGYTVVGNTAVNVYPKYDTLKTGAVVIGDTGFRNIELYPGDGPLGSEANKYQIYDFQLKRWLTPVSIKDNAFDGCTGITSIEIPNTIESIGKQSFKDCTGLTTVVFPSVTKTIGEESFYGANNLVNITIGNNVTSIGEKAFYVSNKTGIGTDILTTNLITINTVGEDHDWIGDHRKFNSHTVTFNTNGGTIVPPVEVRDHGRIKPEPSSTKDAQHLYGWYTDVALTDKWDFATMVVTEPITLYAKWVVAEAYKKLETEGTIPETVWIDTLDQIKTKLFTEEEEMALGNGDANVVAKLDVGAATLDTIPEDEKTIVNNLSKQSTKYELYDIGLRIDYIPIEKTNDDYIESDIINTRTITEISDEQSISIKMKLSDNMKTSIPNGHQRTYFMRGIHEGQVLTIPLTLQDGCLTAPLNKFSTYMVAYKDTDVTPAPTPEKKEDSPSNAPVVTPLTVIPFIANVIKTGDTSSIIIAIVAFIVLGGCLTAYIIVNKRKKK